MAADLIDLAKQFLTPDLISKMSGLVGESPTLTQKAMDLAVPALAGAAFQHASTPSGASTLSQILTSAHPSGGSLGGITDLLSAGNLIQISNLGAGLLPRLLGGNVSAIASYLSKAAGISSSSASTLLQFGVPLVLGAIGKLLPVGGVSAAALTNLFASQKDSIVRQIPQDAAGILNLNGLLKGSQAPEPLMRPVVEKESKPGSRLWLWLLPLLAIILGLIAWRSCSRPTGSRLESLTLPCGTTIQVEQDGFDANLAGFMMKGSDSDLPKRFTFDHLNFDTNSTQVTPDSNATISNLIATVKCFPASQVQLVGYTDKTGSPDANKKLSLDRANAVKTLLVRGGIDSSRIATEGEGQDKPVASNDTDEGRAKNRRTELVVTKIK